MGASSSSTTHDRPHLSKTLANVKCDLRSITPSGTNDHLSVITRDKKRRLASLATLRKKLIRKKRSSRSFDHAKSIKDFVSDWSVRDLNALLEEYESLAALKDLTIQADLARPPANTYKQDLSDLFDYKYCTDVDLFFQDTCFPVHRAVLSVRCPYFRDVLKKCPGYGAQIHIDIRHVRRININEAMFSALLRYLYTGDFDAHEARLVNLDLLIQLGEEFGTPSPLEQDLRYLLDTGDYADCILVFTSENEYQQSSSGSCSRDSNHSEYGFHNRLELPCHKAILSARSPFFRNLIQRRQRFGEELSERALHSPTRIELDESVIPKRYAQVLLHAIYLDSVDLNCIIRNAPSTSSLCEVQVVVDSSRIQPSLIEEAMEIYQIGRFLELDILSQGCEDIIVESLTLENILLVLKWSSQPHGSSWVYRQTMHYLNEEFQAVAQSPVLLELEKSHFIELLQSDYLQASEMEILQAVLRWGEHQLIKRMELREPNLVSNTAHSMAKKGIKKRDLNDVELREILSELLPHVRMDHVLPSNNDVFINAIKRGLISTPPSHMIGDETSNYRINAWIRSRNSGLYVRPRLFTPYWEEIKSLMDDSLTRELEMVRMRIARMSSHIPDTLYMVEDVLPLVEMGSPAGVDVIAGAIPVLDPELLSAMLKRETELRSSPCVQRAHALYFVSRWDVSKQLRLRVVREFNMPDSVADVLENEYYNNSDKCNYPPVQRHYSHCFRSREPPSLIYDSNPCRGIEGEASSCSEGHLSDIMPDIALASSSLGALHLASHELELDLGDRVRHTLSHNSSPMFL